MARSLLFQGRGMTDAMHARWRSHKFIAQSDEADNSNARPRGQVFITRGYMQRFVDWKEAGDGTAWRGKWDEKYTWGGMPGQSTRRSPSINGTPRNVDFRGHVELPHVQNISIRNNMDQNGIGTASIVMQNVYQEETVGLEGFAYHILREGFFSPHYNGDDNFDVQDVDLFLGKGPRSGMTTDENGKVLTGLVMPNRKIEVFQGYGDEVQRTFVGLIDTVSIDAKTGTMTIEATDFGRVLSETSFSKFSCPPARFPVQFCDWDFVKEVSRPKWTKKFGLFRTATPIIDITHIPGRIYGWAGFHTWNRVRAGRIGRTGTGSKVVGDQHRSIRNKFDGEGFDEGSYFIDGINRIKTLTGFMQFITPDWHTSVGDVPDSTEGGDIEGYQRFRDPTWSDDENSRYSIGVPNFAPPNIWQRYSEDGADLSRTGVEQFLDSELLIDGGLVYDYSVVRKQMFVMGTGLKTKKGKPRNFIYHAPFELEAGLITPIYFNVKDEFGINLTEQEIEIFMRRTIMNTMIYFNRGSFTIPGWPAAALNKQVDILESKSGTWRRFFVTGFDSEMSLGPKSSWRSTMEVVNIDNIYIRRIKNQIKKLMGVSQDIPYDDLMFQQARGARTPSWVNKPAQRGT